MFLNLFSNMKIFRIWENHKYLSFFVALPWLTVGFLGYYFSSMIFCPYLFRLKWFGLSEYLSFYDSYSLCMIVLTCFLVPVCMYAGYGLRYYVIYLWIFVFMEFSLIICFLTHDLFVFYIFFEIVSILTFLVILIWGYEQRRSLASYYFFYFTFVSSLLFLVGILYLDFQFSTFNWYIIHSTCCDATTQCIFWWLFFFAFAVKIPMFPFHIWLPEAHVEAPTGGSIILAAILLKLGFYGFFRFSIPLFPWASQYYSSIIYLLCFLSVLHGLLLSLRQVDAKRIVAYSSIGHMNFAVYALFNLTVDGVNGSFLSMIAHAFTSGLLFFVIGLLYKRYGTRSIYYYGGLSKYLPFLFFFFFLTIMSNIAFPLTVSFIAELLIIISLIAKTKLVCLFFIPTLILNLWASLFLYIRLGMSAVNSKISYFFDLTNFDFFIFIFFVFCIFFFGIVPDLFFKYFFFKSSWWFLL